jgi:ATP-dependent helicase/nuclease subunit A
VSIASPDPAGVPLRDQEVRDLIAQALDRTLVVEAAAGTGKTSELIQRILRVLATGRAQVGSLVAVTFTEKAAGELKLRLRQELEVARGDQCSGAQERDRLEHALKNLEEAHISTIHGFCADLLRERPVEAGIDPLFTVLTDAQARRLYDDAFAAWFQEVLEDVPEGVRRSLRRSSRPGPLGESSEDGPVDRLRAAGWNLVEWRDFPEGWTRPVFERRATIEALVEDVTTFAALTARAASPRDLLYVDTAPARRAADELRLIATTGDDDVAEAALVDLCRDRDFRRARKGSGASFGQGVARAAVHAAHQRLVDRLDAFRIDADADLAALLREELRGSIDRYERLKTQHGALDFLDLLLRARNLVRDRDEVRRHFQERFARLFVDEFQDTDPLQAELLLLLAADDPAERRWTSVRPLPGKLFIVGDPKQSIYRFRRADVGIYRAVCEQLARQGALCLRLTTSFRSVPNIQHAVNAAFGPLMTGDVETLQAQYVPLAPSRPALPHQPSLVALPVPKPYGRRNVSGVAIEHSLPDAIGAFVDWLVRDSGWRVTERGGGGPVSIEERHVCLLFRRFVNYGSDVTRAYVDALEARGIRHLLVGGRAFHGREEIETLRAALTAIEWPDDELSVFATLRGALFAIGDEELLEYRHVYAQGFHPFRVPDNLPQHLAPIGEALRLIAALHRRRSRRAVADTITRLFDATRAHVGFALRRAGEQVLANALHVAELARQYELSGGISFRGFVEALREAASDGQAAEAPIVEEGSDGVRLMTVHKAKGLEFPVVILADMTAKLAPIEASRHIDTAGGLCALRIGGWSPRDLLLQQAIEQAREREEGVRVAYVAATRARDLLVVPAIGDQPYAGGWVSPLDRAVYPALAARRHGVPASGCPPFRKDSVLARPDEGIALPHTVSPGLHQIAYASEAPFDAVWWDPAVLRLGAEPPFGLRRQELISKEVAPEVVAAGQRRYLEWRNARDAAVERARRPSLEVLTVTQWSTLAARGPGLSARGSGLGTRGSVLGAEDPRRGIGEPAPVDGPPGPTIDPEPVERVGDRASTPRGAVEVVVVRAAAGRPAGPRYGALVHAALATIPLDAGAGTIARVAATQGRIVGATDEEVASAIEVVSTVLAHPVLTAARSAFAAGRLHRETPVTVVREGILIEGVVDIAFDTDGDGFTVVDFKTDRADGDAGARYEQQVALYADAIAQATGRPARAVLMHV